MGSRSEVIVPALWNGPEERSEARQLQRTGRLQADVQRPIREGDAVFDDSLTTISVGCALDGDRW